MLRPHHEDRNAARTEHRETCMLVLKEWPILIRLWRTVAVREYRLDDFQRPRLFLDFLCVVQWDIWNLCVRRRCYAQVVLQEEHLHDLAEVF